VIHVILVRMMVDVTVSSDLRALLRRALHGLDPTSAR